MMTTKNARDFLDKELFVKRSIVTFRSLSRELGIHVNDAKNELQHYYDAVRETDAPAVPTYLVSGEVPALIVRHRFETQQSDSTMDVDLEFEEDREEEMDVVHQSKVLLVDARTLDEAMSQFSRIHSVHIYSLSPSRFGDVGLVCTPSFKVHKADAKGGLGSFSVSGKITGSHVKLKAGVAYQRAASSSKTTLDIPAKAAPRAVASTRAAQQTTKGKTPSSETKEQVSTTTALPKTEYKDRSKPSGKLDWSKAKTKGKEPVAEKTRDEKKPKPEPDSTVTTKNSSTNRNPGLTSMKPLVPISESSGVASSDAQKRGKKRKSHIGTDIESDSSSAKAKPSNAAGSSVKKVEAYSDDDDDGKLRMLGQRRSKRKSTITSDSEMSLRAMMDIDDEQVDRVARISKIHALRQEEEESEEEMNEPQKEATVPPATSEDEESDHVPIVTKKKKPRKVVHVGRNGLKKRRVIKSRMTTDAKGYMQTEDYSSYESVEDEEEAETKPEDKGRETKKVSEPKVEEAKPKAVAKEESVGKLKAKAPKTRGGASKRRGLLNFFGPERGKK
ncbi:DNA polymerase subunit Cdc27 [Butyriboletus roseoflavus]|nr:DNA polymerase subunit Cdc27 [Butyriboletus roseoflavus]